VFWIELNECACWMRCLAKFDVWLFVLKAFSCLLNLTAKLLPVCPTYALLQSGHVRLYVSDCARISDVCCLCINNLWMVLLVRHAIPRSVILNRFVIKVVFSKAGERIPFLCRGSHSFVWGDGGLSRGWWVVWVDRKSLFCMLRIVFSSASYSFSCRLYVFRLLYRNLTAACFVLGWVVGGVGDYRVCESWFSVYGRLPTGGGSLVGDVEVVYVIVGLDFGSELQVGCIVLK
jgi:hypothetical protein